MMVMASLTGKWLPNSCLSIVRVEPKGNDVEGYYERLGIDFSATDDEVRSAAKALMLKTHPDAGGSEYEFMLVHEAYSVLSNPASRARYDAMEHRSAGETGVRVKVVGEERKTESVVGMPAFFKEPSSILTESDIRLVCEWRDMLLEAAWDFHASFDVKAGIGDCPYGYSVDGDVAVIGFGVEPERWAADAFVLMKMIESMSF